MSYMSLSTHVKRWAYYGFANHSYQVVYVAFILPIFFAGAFARYHFALSAWGFATGVSTILGVVLAIVLGNYADKTDKLRVYKISIILTCVGMCAMAFSTRLPLAMYILFIITNALFIWSLALYDSILPHVSDWSTVYEYGGFSWGFGYVGGIASLIIALILQYFTGAYSMWVFLSVPAFYIIFSIYSLSGLESISFNEPLRPSLSEKRSAELEYPNTPILSVSRKVILFIGYWLISECVTVILIFDATYLSGEMHFSALKVGVVFLFVQLIGFPATWYGGRLERRFSGLTLLGVTILLWGIAIGLVTVFNVGVFGLIVALCLMGLSIGNTQSYMRSQFATFVPKKESGLQFGVYSFVSEAAVIVGPVIYGFASDTLNSQKLPLIGLFVLMLVGYALVWKITSVNK